MNSASSSSAQSPAIFFHCSGLGAALAHFQILFTARGLLLLILVAYLLFWPAAREADVIASVFSYLLLTIMALTALLCLISGRRLYRTLRLTITPPAAVQGDQKQPQDAFAGEAGVFVLRTPPLRILPFFVLQLDIEFEMPGIDLPSLHLTGFDREPRTIKQHVRFPHRGHWHIGRVTAALGDRLGFTRYSWLLAGPAVYAGCRVRPPVRTVHDIPIISSSERPGDTVVDMHNRHGDPFDLKPYHPSDGMRKILWKVYAKSGQLLARHPEPAITPEGQTILFCVAGKEEDLVTSAALAYVRELAEMDLAIFFGCAGMADAEPATTPEEAEELVIDTVWNFESRGEGALQPELHQLLAACAKAHPHIRIEKVLIIAANKRVRTHSTASALLELGDLLSAQGAEPVFIVVETARRGASRPPRPAPGWRRCCRSWFLGASEPDEPAGMDDTPFFRVCLKKQWQVIMAENLVP